jgi:hypothetical protein
VKQLSHSLQCPWCGRTVICPRTGVLPAHKRIVGTHPKTGDVVREWCPGGGELPLSLSVEQRRHLRTRWRDEGGELVDEGSDDS